MASAACPVNPSLTCVDDATSDISYAGSWNSLSGTSGYSPWTSKSVHITSSNGSQASFQFSGTSMLVYGLWDPYGGGPDGLSYTVDDGKQIVYNPENIPITSPLPQLLFNVSGLSSGTHLFVITNEHGIFQLDSLQFHSSSSSTVSALSTNSTVSTFPAGPTASMSISSHSSPKIQSDSTSLTGSTSGDTSQGSTSTTFSSSLRTENTHTVVSQPGTAEHRNLSSGALAGICLAAIIVLGILVLVLGRARKRKIESSKARAPNPIPVLSLTVTQHTPSTSHYSSPVFSRPSSPADATAGEAVLSSAAASEHPSIAKPLPPGISSPQAHAASSSSAVSPISPALILPPAVSSAQPSSPRSAIPKGENAQSSLPPLSPSVAGDSPTHSAATSAETLYYNLDSRGETPPPPYA